MMQLCLILSSVLLVSEISATPLLDVDSNIVLVRPARSPTFHKKHGHGGLLFGGGGGGNSYVTNINNFGPPSHGHGHGPAGGSFASSSASAGGHASAAQSQAASVALGPFSASFSQSQAQSGGGGRRGGLFDYFDY